MSIFLLDHVHRAVPRNPGVRQSFVVFQFPPRKDDSLPLDRGALVLAEHDLDLESRGRRRDLEREVTSVQGFDKESHIFLLQFLSEGSGSKSLKYLGLQSPPLVHNLALSRVFLVGV